MSQSLDDLLGFGSADPPGAGDPPPQTAPPAGTPPAGTPPSGEGTPPGPPPDMAAVMAQNRELIDKVAQLVDRQTAPPPAAPPPPTQFGGAAAPGGMAVLPNGQPMNRENSVKFLETEFLKNPGEFLLNAFGLMQNLANQAAASASQPHAAALTGSGIEGFKQRMATTDPYYAATLPEFERLVAEARTNGTLNPGNLDATVNSLYSQALGTAIRTRPANGRQQQPPPYGVGGGAGSGNSGAQMGAAGAHGLSEEQRIAVQTLKDSGYDDATVTQMLKTWNDA
jgi:hypothetical protein